MDCQSVEADLNTNSCAVASRLPTPAGHFTPRDRHSPDAVLPNLAAISNWWIELFGLNIRQTL
jgi:hypothetical protein